MFSSITSVDKIQPLLLTEHVGFPSPAEKFFNLPLIENGIDVMICQMNGQPIYQTIVTDHTIDIEARCG